MVATRLSLARKSLQQQASTSSPVCTLKSCLHDKRKTTKKMCAICKAPLPSPSMPQKVSSGDTPSNVSPNTEAPLPPPPMPLMVSSGDSPANVSSITEAPLPPPTLPPLGSTKELERRYEEVLLRDNDLDEDIADTKAELKKTEEKEEHLKRQIEELKQKLANIEQKKENLKNDEYIYTAARKITQSEMEELGTRKDAAEVAQKELEQHKNEVLNGMVSVTRRLKSIR